MDLIERVAVFLMVSRRLTALLEEERRLTARLAFDEIEAVWREKSLMTEAYGVEMAKLHRESDRFRDLSPELRQSLAQALADLEGALHANLTELVEAERRIARFQRGAWKSLADSLTERPPAVEPPADRPEVPRASQPAAKVIPLAARG